MTADEPAPDRTRMQEATLERLEIAVRRRVRDDVGPSVAESVTVRYLVDMLVYEMRALVLAERLPPQQVTRRERVTSVVPDGWWATFRYTYRDRWWMSWAARRWPAPMRTEEHVVELTVDIDRYWTYPRAALTMPEHLHDPVRMATWTDQVRQWPA